MFHSLYHFILLIIPSPPRSSRSSWHCFPFSSYHPDWLLCWLIIIHAQTPTICIPQGFPWTPLSSFSALSLQFPCVQLSLCKGYADHMQNYFLLSRTLSVVFWIFSTGCLLGISYVQDKATFFLSNSFLSNFAIFLGDTTIQFCRFFPLASHPFPSLHFSSHYLTPVSPSPHSFTWTKEPSSWLPPSPVHLPHSCQNNNPKVHVKALKNSCWLVDWCLLNKEESSQETKGSSGGW